MVNSVSGSPYPLGITPAPYSETENTSAPLPSASRSVTEQSTQKQNKTPPRSALGLEARINEFKRTSASTSVNSHLMNLPIEMVDEIAGHLNSNDLMSLSKTGQDFYNTFFITAQRLGQTSNETSLWRKPAHERQATANRFLNGIKSLRKADMDDKPKLLRQFAQQFDFIPDNDERKQSAREFYSLLADMPMSLTLARTTQAVRVSWLPNAERTEALNTVLGIQERLISYGFMPADCNPLKAIRGEIKFIPASSQSAAYNRMIPMTNAMVAS